MLPQLKQHLAQIFQSFPVKLHHYHTGPARGTEPNDLHILLIPTEVVLPVVLSGVKKRDFLLSDRIKAGGFVVLMAIATLASQSEIFGCIRTSLAEGQDVFDRERLGSKNGLAQAIFATALGPLIRQFFEWLWKDKDGSSQEAES